ESNISIDTLLIDTYVFPGVDVCIVAWWVVGAYILSHRQAASLHNPTFRVPRSRPLDPHQHIFAHPAHHVPGAGHDRAEPAVAILEGDDRPIGFDVQQDLRVVGRAGAHVQAGGGRAVPDAEVGRAQRRLVVRVALIEIADDAVGQASGDQVGLAGEQRAVV